MSGLSLEYTDAWAKCKTCTLCPFAMTEESETAQNFGCLPSPVEIIALMEKHQMSWSCHDEDGKLCSGYASAGVTKDGKTIEHIKGRPLISTKTYLEKGVVITAEAAKLLIEHGMEDAIRLNPESGR